MSKWQFMLLWMRFGRSLMRFPAPARAMILYAFLSGVEQAFDKYTPKAKILQFPPKDAA